jgi:hypothetical protein
MRWRRSHHLVAVFVVFLSSFLKKVMKRRGRRVEVEERMKSEV